MSLLKNIANVSKEEQVKFIRSFDQVVFNVDGRIWSTLETLPKTQECTEYLKKIGKDVKYITNNSDLSISTVLEYLKKNNFSLKSDDLFHPVMTIVSHFQKIHFKKEIFVIGSSHIKAELKKAGFKLADDAPTEIEPDFGTVITHNVGNKNVGTILVDYDVNLNYIKMSKSVWPLLQNSDCNLVYSNVAKTMESGEKGPLLGMYDFAEGLRAMSGKECVHLEKPSPFYFEVLKEKMNVTNPNRTLFIKERIEQDTEVHGFQTLLVLRDVEKEDLFPFQYPEESGVQYFVENFETLNRILESICY